MIPVTKPFTPPIEEYKGYIDTIFANEWFTNHGPLVTKLESDLKHHLGLNNLWFLNNGTIAIQIAIKALELTGEVITTPFSYVATTSAPVWEGCTPVFADIDRETLTLDPQSVEERITENTTGIIATHVYGIPCNVAALEAIAKKHNLKIIYDAAHAFGVTYNGQSVLNYGDISTLSFHATKLFHTGEGGAVVTTNNALAAKMALLRNFGHTSPVSFDGVGINGKNSEFHAAMGLCVLKYIDEIIARRKEISSWYTTLLQGLPITRPVIASNVGYNYAYYPVIFESEEVLLKVLGKLAENAITARRYFYPSLNTINYVNYIPCPVAEDIAPRIACLPLYHKLTQQQVELICTLIKESLS